MAAGVAHTLAYSANHNCRVTSYLPLCFWTSYRVEFAQHLPRESKCPSQVVSLSYTTVNDEFLALMLSNESWLDHNLDTEPITNMQ